MNIIRLFVNGFLIGIANIIPGMSGGTFALVLGIYERLISALRNIGLQTVKRLFGILTFRRTAIESLKSELHRIDFSFLMILGIGVVAAVLVLTELIEGLYKLHHEPTCGFFFGLVLTSILIPLRMLKGFGWRELIFLLVAATFIVLIEEVKKVGAETASVSTKSVSLSIRTFITFFICGAIAISAMILPGVSGSFLLLAFGFYFPLVTTINNFKEGVPSLLSGDVDQPFLSNLLILTIFAFGCLFGLLVFTRLLKFLLERYRNLTISFLIGLMFGSLYGLWPFRDYEMVGGERYDTAHILPQLNMNLLITVCAFWLGVLLSMGFPC